MAVISEDENNLINLIDKKNAYDIMNQSEKNNSTNDSKEGIINVNESEKDSIRVNKMIIEPKENKLSNSKKIKRNYPFKNTRALQKKRGRKKKANNQRNHSKNHNDNIKLKIRGYIIDSIRIFINKNFGDKKNNLKKLNYKEEKTKFHMDKKLREIFKNISKRCKRNHNKNLIDKNDEKLQAIMGLPIYKVFQHISGKKVQIIEGVEKEYNILKNAKLLKETDDYKIRYNSNETKLFNLASNYSESLDDQIKEISEFPVNIKNTNNNNMSYFSQNRESSYSISVINKSSIPLPFQITPSPFQITPSEGDILYPFSEFYPFAISLSFNGSSTNKDDFNSNFIQFYQ